MRVTVQQGQNIYDIAKMYYGGVEGVQLLIADNPTVITDIRQKLVPGTVLNITSDAVNSVVVRQLKSRDERVPLNEKTVFANDDNYTFDVWQDFSASAGGNITINCLIIDVNGSFWVATATKGVYIYDGSSWLNFGNGDGALNSDAINWLYEDSSTGWIYAATAGGIAVWKTSAFVSNYTTTDGLPSNACKWVGKTNSRFYYGTDTGAGFTSNWSTFTNYTSADPQLNSNDVRHGFVDAAGDLWWSTAAGVSKWPIGGTTVHYTLAGGELPDDDVVHVFGYNGIIYVATATDGLVIFDGSNWITHDTTGPNAPNDKPNCLAVDSNAVVFCGFKNTTSSALSIVRRRDSWSLESSNTISDMPNDSVRCMVIDNEDNIWIGTKTHGVWYYNRNILING